MHIHSFSSPKILFLVSTSYFQFILNLLYLFLNSAIELPSIKYKIFFTCYDKMNAKIKVRSSWVTKKPKKKQQQWKKKTKPNTKTQGQKLFCCLRVYKNIYETCHNIWNCFLALGCDTDWLLRQFMQKENRITAGSSNVSI